MNGILIILFSAAVSASADPYLLLQESFEKKTLERIMEPRPLRYQSKDPRFQKIPLLKVSQQTPAPKERGSGERAVDFLLAQESSGAWKPGWAPNNGEMAVTALAVRALSRQNKTEAVEKAIQRGREYLLNNGPEPGTPLHAPETPVWNEKFFSYGFALSAFSEMEKSEDKSLAVKYIVRELELLQQRNGSFSYRMDSYGTSFHTAVVLLGLIDIEEDKVELDPETAAIISRIKVKVVEALERARSKDGYFAYQIEMSTFSSHPMSAGGRSILCNLALYRAKSAKVKKEDLLISLKNFFDNRGTLIRAFEATDGMGVHQKDKDDAAPYYYLFSHYYAALALKELGSLAPSHYKAELARGISRMQETPGVRLGAQDGAYFDTNHGGRSYGTAIALLALDALK